jgi:phytoene dehydrogenase-like protein
MTEHADAIVIGAGHNGLVCAACLARAGMKVLCLEAANRAGGMAAPRTLGGAYQIAGVAHVAYPLASNVRQELGLERFGYRAGPPVDTVVLDPDGRHLTIGPERVSGGGLSDKDAKAWPLFRQQYLAFAKALRPLFENTPPRLKHMGRADKGSLAKLGWNLRVGLGRESMYEFLRVAAINIYDVLNETFDDDRLKGAIATDAVLGSAMGPRTPGTVLTWLQRLHSELNGSLAVQTAGPNGVIDALLKACEAAGVTVRTGARVDRIVVENDTAIGVRLSSGEVLKAQTIVSNADPRSTFNELVGASRLDALFAQRVRQVRGAGVVAKIHLALRSRPGFRGLPDAALGARLLVAPSMNYVERAFNHSKYQEYSDQPVLEITIPTLHSSRLAPEGHHVISINAAWAPYELDGGWEHSKKSFVDGVVAQLGRYAPGLEEMIVDHECLTPQDIEQEYGAVQGHWHHGELSLHQSLMMRPVYGAAQYDTPVAHLFLCGAGTHPGGGLTGQPGRKAARRIVDFRTAK